MNLFSPWSLDRIARGIHYRVGLRIAKKDIVAQKLSNESLAQRIRETHTKINMGCGRDKRPGYLNVDTDPAASLDILLVNGDDSMIPRQHFVEVLARDVLEHIPRAQTLAALLDWADYLVDGGKLTDKGRDLNFLALDLDRYSPNDWALCLRALVAAKKAPYTIIFFNPFLHDPKNVAILRELGKSTRFASFVKPVNLIEVMQRLRIWSKEAKDSE